MSTGNVRKGNRKLTLSINEDVLEKYKAYCEKEGIVLSKQIEKFMHDQMERGARR